MCSECDQQTSELCLSRELGRRAAAVPVKGRTVNSGLRDFAVIAVVCSTFIGIILWVQPYAPEPIPEPFDTVIPACPEGNFSDGKVTESVTGQERPFAQLWNISDRFERRCFDNREVLRLSMTLYLFETSVLAQHFFDEALLLREVNWTRDVPLWESEHPPFQYEPDSIRYWFEEFFDPNAVGFPEDNGWTTLGVHARFGQIVATYEIRRVIPRTVFFIWEVTPPIPEHAAILYRSIVTTSNRLNEIE